MHVEHRFKKNSEIPQKTSSQRILKAEIIDSVHIEHADKIIEQLRIDDYLQLYMDTRDDKVVAVYTISDIGMAALEERRELIFDRLITRTLSIAAIIISILALLSQLGILRLPQY